MKRGEIWLIDLDLGFGQEIRKKRPALVISADSFNNSLHTIIIIPFSSRIPQVLSPEMVVVLPSKNTGIEKKSVILSLLIRSVDKDRLIKKIGLLQSEKLEEVEDSLRLVLGMIKLN